MTKSCKKQRRQRDNHPTQRAFPKFKPISEEQGHAYDMCWDNDISFLTGPAGCSKTYTAVAFAVDKILSGSVDKIIFCRPAVEACGGDLGYLPGTAIQKVSAYMRPMFDCLSDYAGDFAPGIKESLSIEPLEFMRGRTIKNSVLILDEAQNAGFSQLKMLLTRIGAGTSMVLCGDADQSDVHSSPLMRVAQTMSRVDGIAHLHFSKTSGAIRHPLIPEILDVFEELSSGRTQNA
jgi:phosphate starvation-inducible PhoH-like protein